MNPRSLLLLVLFLVAAGTVVWLATRPSPPADPVDVTLERAGDLDAERERPARPPVRPGEGVTVDPEGGGEGRRPAAGATTVMGLREPSGIDLSDPAQVREALRLALEETPPDWRAARRLLELHREPLDADVRRRLLAALGGPDRHLAKEALALAQDPALVGDLLGVLDDPELSGDVRSAALDVLARMPGADAAQVVLGLEARLEGDPLRDASVLGAIARRGGPEAARAIVGYVEKAPDPLRVPGRLGLGQQLRDDPEAARVVAEAIARTERAETLVALSALAVAPGAEPLVPALVGLDTEDRPDDLRRAALEALAQIGTASAVEHLIKASRAEGAVAEGALDAIGRIPNADAKARALLMAAFEDAENAPRPHETKRELLSALSNLGHPAAAPAFRDALAEGDDRIRQSAALGLGRMGAQGRPYIRDLMRAYANSDTRVRRTIVQALGMVGGEEARSLLEQMLADASLHAGVRRAATAAIQRLGPKPEPDDTSPERLRGAGR